jgi:hypothetical protein
MLLSSSVTRLTLVPAHQEIRAKIWLQSSLIGFRDLSDLTRRPGLPSNDHKPSDPNMPVATPTQQPIILKHPPLKINHLTSRPSPHHLLTSLASRPLLTPLRSCCLDRPRPPEGPPQAWHGRVLGVPRQEGRAEEGGEGCEA